MLTDEQLMRTLMRAMARARRHPPENPGECRLPFGKGFGYILDLLVERDGVSQQQLAEIVGVSRQTINAIEKGDYNPTIKLCLAICKVLDKTLDELFWEE